LSSQNPTGLELGTGSTKIPNDDDEGIIRVHLKDEAVIKFLSEGIYASWKSAVRELFANELTAALTAREMAETQKQESPTIEITVDPDRRELTIQGKNSLGIKMDTFADKMIYYGRSGNVSPKRPGRFGFGAKSYVSIGKSIRIESFARETGERYGIIGSEGIHFKRIPDSELTISEYGTKVSIILRNDVRGGGAEGGGEGGGGGGEESKEVTHDWTRSYLPSPSSDRPKRKVIELDELIETIENVCRFSEIGTYLTITSDHKITKHSPYSHYVYETTINRQVRKKINFTPREYAASRIAQGNQSTSVRFEFELDDPDFYFYGLLATSGRDENEVDVNPDNGEVRLLCMPIGATISPAEDKNHATKEGEKPRYPMTYWYVNLKDEVKFEPTPDRERLREGVYKEVHGKITEFLKGRFADMEIKSFEDYRSSKYKPILNSHSNRHLQAFLTDSTKQVCSVLDTEVITVGEGLKEDIDGFSRRLHRNARGYNPKLRELVAKTENLFMLQRELTNSGKEFVLPKKTALNLLKLIRVKYPDAAVFLYPATYSSWRLNEALPKIIELGKKLRTQFFIKDAKIETASIKRELKGDWRKISGIERGKKSAEKNREVVVWKSTRDYCSSIIDPIRVKPSCVDNKTVRIRGNMKKWIDLLKKYSVREYGITKDIKGLTRGMSEEEFRDLLSERSVATEKGRETLREIEHSLFELYKSKKIIEANPRITVLQFHDPRILKFYKPKNTKMICTKTDKETFEAVAYLKLSNVDFKAREVVRAKDLKQELMKCCERFEEREENEKSIFFLLNSEKDDEEEEESWTSRSDAANYLFMAVSMMNEKKRKREDSSIGAISRRMKLVSLLWDSLLNLYDTEKMELIVRTAVKYA
jgi:hypothetical protein